MNTFFFFFFFKKKDPTNTEFIYRDLQRTGYSPIVEEKLQELRNQIQIGKLIFFYSLIKIKIVHIFFPVSERDGVPANRWDLTAYYGKPGFEFEE